MDLQSLPGLNTRTDSALTQGNAGKTQKAPDSLAKMSPALAKARERLVLQEQSTATSLSLLGRYKASLAALGGTAGAMGKLGANATPASVQSALDAFVADYNATVTAARQSFTQGSNVGTSTLLGELRRVLMPRADAPSLHSLGVTTQADGTLKVSAAALKTAMDKAGVNVTGALAKLGTAVGKLAEGGLGKSSRLSSALTSLNSQMAALQKQEDALLTAAAKLANGGKSGADSNPISKAMQQAYLGQSAPPTGP